MKKSLFLFIVTMLIALPVVAGGPPCPLYTKHVRKFSTDEKWDKTVLITGGAGFIGSNFLHYMYHKYPDYKFLVLDALTYAGRLENISDDIKESDRFEFWYGSITNHDLVEMLMNRVDFVVHFAAESAVTRSIFDNSKFYETDVIGTQVLMNALLKSSTVERYIHISTSEVYGTADYEPMDEAHPLKPRSPYAGAKAGADRLVYSYWITYDLPVVIVRPFNNYGPRQHTEKLIPRLISRAHEKQPLQVHGDGSAKRDWLHVDDHCRALDMILHTPKFEAIKNEVVNVGTGISVSVLDIARAVLAYFDLPEDEYLEFVGDRPGQVACHIAAHSKIKELIGWEPGISFEEGLEKTIHWYVENPEWWMGLRWMTTVPILINNKVEMQ